MNSYDAWKEGRFNPESPINRIEFETSPIWTNLTEAYESGHTEIFAKLQAEIINELNILLEIAKLNASGTKSRIEDLINKCK